MQASAANAKHIELTLNYNFKTLKLRTKNYSKQHKEVVYHCKNEKKHKT